MNRRFFIYCNLASSCACSVGVGVDRGMHVGLQGSWPNGPVHLYTAVIQSKHLTGPGDMMIVNRLQSSAFRADVVADFAVRVQR